MLKEKLLRLALCAASIGSIFRNIFSFSLSFDQFTVCMCEYMWQNALSFIPAISVKMVQQVHLMPFQLTLICGGDFTFAIVSCLCTSKSNYRWFGRTERCGEWSQNGRKEKGFSSKLNRLLFTANMTKSSNHNNMVFLWNSLRYSRCLWLYKK